MSDATGNEQILIEYFIFRGRGDTPLDDEQIESRRRSDPQFDELYRKLEKTFAALSRASDGDPPADMPERIISAVEDRAAAGEKSLPVEELMNRSNERPTFSLRELAAMAVAAVILATMVLVSHREAQKVTNRQLCRANLGQIGNALMFYANGNDGYLPHAAKLTAGDGRRLRWLGQNGREAVSNSAALFKLIKAGYARPEMFLCPGVSGEKPAGFTVTADMNDFPNEDCIHYSYQHTLGPYGRGRKGDGNPPLSVNLAPMSRVAERMAILADSTPLFEKGCFHPDRLDKPAGRNHDGAGQNVLYLDMHAEWAEKPSIGVNGNHIFLADGIRDYDGDETPNDPTDTFLLPTYSGK